jgi:hypothetical protein
VDINSILDAIAKVLAIVAAWLQIRGQRRRDKDQDTNE